MLMGLEETEITKGIENELGLETEGLPSYLTMS
jgi:hypothetical protein